MKKLAMELLGTFFLVLTILMTGNAFAIAAMLMAWVYIGGFVSGGHYNPMVSLAVAVRGRLGWHELPWYMVAQVVGGAVAFVATAFLHGSVVIPAPGAGVTVVQAFGVEFLLAFVLALVVLTVATSVRFKTSHVFGFAIGFTVPALAALGGPISGGLFNPAIAVGGALFSLTHGVPLVWEHVAMYVVGALLGGFVAAHAFNYFEVE